MTTTKGARRLQETFQRAADEGRAAFIPYVTAGDPDLEGTKALVAALVEGGADIVEIGLPFSDPLADGPTIQRSGQRALAGGVTREGVFGAIRELREEGVDAPVVLLAYYNTVHRRGEDRFLHEAAAAGVDGVITPDVPPEEAVSLRAAAARSGIAVAPLVAPTSPPKRIRRIASVAEGFLYCVSVTGVTGPRRHASGAVTAFLRKVRREANPGVPLALGFGVSSPEQAAAYAKDADGVIVGSALLQRLEEAPSRHDALQEATAWARRFRAATTRADAG